MVYLKEPQVLLKHSTCVCRDVCVCMCLDGEWEGGGERWLE